ncbi:hypothetical protein SMMN14_08696 [Sphaerulina musiva]
MLPTRNTMRPRRAYMVQQQRTFLGLQKTPPPPPKTMAWLVLQGLAVVLVADLAIATATGEPTTIRSVAQSAGLWQDAPPFKQTHVQKKLNEAEQGKE